MQLIELTLVVKCHADTQSCSETFLIKKKINFYDLGPTVPMYRFKLFTTRHLGQERLRERDPQGVSHVTSRWGKHTRVCEERSRPNDTRE